MAMRIKSWNPQKVISLAMDKATIKLGKIGSEMVDYIRNQMKTTPLDYSKPYPHEDGLHFPSQSGGYPAIWYSDLYEAVEYKIVRKGNMVSLLVGVNLDQPDTEGYALWLEYGTRKMEARPWLEPTLFQFEGRLREIFSV